MNLKYETLNKMDMFCKTKEDIAWIGCVDFSIPVDLFFELADVEYDDGFGSPEVAQDLKIVFNDNTALYRHEYDGAECWKYINLNKPKQERNDITALIAGQVDLDKTDYGWVDTCSLFLMNSE